MAIPLGRDLSVLALILLLGLALRVAGLNAPLWFDEIVMLEYHLRLPWGDMMDSYSMNHHYLYSLQAKAAMDWLGEAPWVLRLPAVAFGLASIAAAWWLARDLATTAVAHLTALLLALSYHHIWFSQNARGYTELAFWCTLGLILFLRGRARPGVAIWLGFAATVALAIFTHLTGAFFFLALGLVWLGTLAFGRTPRPDGAIAMPLLGFGLGLALTLLVYSPVLPSLFDTVAVVSDTSAVDAVPEYQNPLWTVAEAVRTGLGAAGPQVLLVAFAVVALATLGAATARPPGPLFGLIVLTHILLTMALLTVIGMRIWPRFFFLDIGFLMILIVMGVAEACGTAGRILRRPAFGSGLFVAAAAAMLLISAALAARNYSAPKQDLAGAVALAESQRRDGERIYAVGHAADAFEDHFHTGWTRLMDDAGYRDAIAQPGPVTFVLGFPHRVLRAIPRIQADLDSGAISLHDRLPGTLGDGAVLILRR